MTLFPHITEEVHRLIQANKKYGRQVCTCGTDLTGCTVEGYSHPDGWDVPASENNHAGKYWLFLKCPKCGYEWAIWKLGISREHSFVKEDNPALLGHGVNDRW